MPAVRQRALGDEVAVRQQHRERGAIGAQGDRVAREHVGTIREVRDAAEALGLALRAEHAGGHVEPFERGVARRRDARVHGERARVGRIEQREAVAVDAHARCGHRHPVELDAYFVLLLAVEQQRHRAVLRRRVRIAAERELCGHPGRVGHEVELDLERVDEERRGTVVEAALDVRAGIARQHGRSAYFTSMSSTSKMSVALGGITPPAPRSPYP